MNNSVGNLFTARSLAVPARQAVSGIADTALTLHVIVGRVWITVEGMPDDYWLSAGESLTVAPGRLVVIEADRVDSRVDFPPSRGRRASSWFAGWRHRLRVA